MNRDGPPQVTGPPITGDYRPRIRAHVNRLLAEAHAQGLGGAEALAHLDRHGLRPPPYHQYQLWLKERKLARIALGLLPPDPSRPARPAVPVPAGQLSLLEDP